MRIDNVKLIDASIERLWALTVEVERWPEFLETVSGVERLDAGAFGPGCRVRVEQPGLRSALWTVTELAAPSRFVWETRTLGVRVVASHLIERDGEQCSNRLVIDLTGWASGLLGRLTRRRIRSMLSVENACFERAAARADGRDRSSASDGPGTHPQR